MGLELLMRMDGQLITVQRGLEELKDTAYTFDRNLQARLDTPVLESDTNLWYTWLDSRTIQLYGGVNDDQRCRFKIDHSFDLSAIIGARIQSDGSVAIDPTKYSQSQGTEFIIISRDELNGADKSYAIRVDNYNTIKSALNESRQAGKKYDLTALTQARGFAINSDLTPGEVIATKEKTGKVTKFHDGWLELAVGRNNNSTEGYFKAEDLLKRYVLEAQRNGCFEEGVGMGFYVETGVKDYKARSWFVLNSDNRSGAYGRYRLNLDGRFLRVHSGVAAEGDAAQKTDVVTQAYETVLANVPQLPPDKVIKLYEVLHPIVTGIAIRAAQQ